MHMVLPNTISRTQYKCSKHLTVIFAWFPKLSCFSEDFPLIGQQRPIFYCLIGRLMLFFSISTAEASTPMYFRSKHEASTLMLITTLYWHWYHHQHRLLIFMESSLCVFISLVHTNGTTWKPFNLSNIQIYDPKHNRYWQLHKNQIVFQDLLQPDI